VIGAGMTGIADLVAAVWIWTGLVVAAVGAGGGLFWWGYRVGRYERGRLRVLSAVEAAIAETVVIPRPRQDVDR
jgi:hypothetical protein